MQSLGCRARSIFQISVLLVVCVLAAVQRGSAIGSGQTVYKLVGTYSDYPGGTGIGYLTLQNYTPGSALNISNFVSFTYDGLIHLAYTANIAPFSSSSVLSGSLPGSLATTPGWAGVDLRWDSSAAHIVLQTDQFGNEWCTGVGSCVGDTGGIYTWSPTTAPPAVPTLLSPANGASLAAGTTSTVLQWSAVSGATSYNVEVDTGSCGGTVFSGPNNTTATSFTLTGLTTGPQYYWRVASVGPGGASAFSGCFNFSVATPAVPVLPGWALALLALLLAAVSSGMLRKRRLAGN
jgi:hypothetical protein